MRDANGKMIKPAFAIAKNKVKLIGANPGNINVNSNGGSTSNLHSSSDLGKYTNSANGKNLPSQNPSP